MSTPPSKPRTWFDERGLVVERAGQPARSIPFYAGAMHYWRVPPARWAACLAQIHALGLTLVETYVPWRVHETKHGHYDWQGERGELDLSRFLELASAAGLGVVLRPGPHVNAELTAFGFPDHVLADERYQARTVRGTPAWMPSPPRGWPIPSYASAAFRDHVHAWYQAVAEVAAPFLAPAGPVVAVGVDNEAQLFFRNGAFDHDYHPDAIAWWNDVHGGEPPRAFDPADAGRAAAWVRFKDQYIARALGEFAKSLDAVGFAGIARFHNLPPGHHGLYDLRSIQSAIGGPVGIDAYTPRREFRELRRRATSLVGNASPVPIAFEVGVGFFPWFPPLHDDRVRDPDRERDHLLTLLAAGTRGFNLFMAVERDRYYGAAIAQTGQLESHAKWIAPLVRALNAVDWPSLRRHHAIALVHTKADMRFGIATNLVDPLPSTVAELLDLGPGGAAELGTDAGAIDARKWHDAVAAALELAQVSYAIVDESTPEAELARYRAIVVPTGHRVDAALWQTLRSISEKKAATVVIGPLTPTRDELDRPLADPAPRRVGRLQAGSLQDLAGLAEDLAGLAGELSESWIVERPDSVRATAYADAAGNVRVVFVTSDADKAVTATLLADGRGLRDPFTDELIPITAGKSGIALPPRGVRILLVE